VSEESVPADNLIEGRVVSLALMVAKRYAFGPTLPGSLISSEWLGIDQKSAQLLALLFGDVEVFHLWRGLIRGDVIDSGSSLLFDGRLGSVRASGSEYRRHARG
jgi:hypothetical protein